jgi:Na+/proline symporter
MGGLWEAAGAAGKLDLLEFAPESFFGGLSIYSGLLGGALLSMATHGTDQLIVQRLLACRSPRAARAAMVGSGVLVLLQMAFFLLVGLALWGFYRERGLAGRIEQKEVFARFLVNELPSGLSGLIVAAAFAAAMSTLSSSLNSLASATVNDFYIPLTGGAKGERHYLRAGRAGTLLWGIALMGVALPAREFDELLQAGLSIGAITAGGVLGLFLLSPLGKRGGVAGMFLAIALCACFWVDGRAGWGLLPALHWTWLTPLGLAVSLATAGAAALFLRPGR